MEGLELLASLDEVLAEGEKLLAGLSDRDYAQGGANGSTIGAHYRHSLEHFQLVFEALAGEEIDYDMRARDRELECERTRALALTRELREAARFLHAAHLGRPIVVICQTSYGQSPPSTAASSFGREVMYAISHAVHHHALIALICARNGIEVPGNFGIAPSTLRYRRQSAAG